MRNIKLTIEYDGTHLNGWQEQSGKTRTVQKIICQALKKIIHEDVTLIGSGRTDAGVHALGQVAHFKTTAKLAVERFTNALNAHLSDDISIVKSQEVSLDFHAQYSPRSKVYRYTIMNRWSRSAVHAKTAWHYPYAINVGLMKKEAHGLVGKKDFKAFQATDHKRVDTGTTRNMKDIRILKKGDLIVIELEADGFLYKMVRNIVGTLAEVGSGKLPPGSVKKILKSKNRQLASPTAPALGLCLLRVNY